MQTGKLLGHGAFGVVILVKHHEFGKIALKIISSKNDDQKDEEQICHEGEIGIRLKKHPNILNYLEFQSNCSPSPTLISQINKLLRKSGSNKRLSLKCHLLLTEHCNGGDLQSWLTSPVEPTRTRGAVNDLFTQILEGVEFLHLEHNLVHGDLKPDNFFLHHTKDGTIIIKIGDFGEALVEGDDSTRRVAFTRLFADPEMEVTRRTKAFDIHSLACIFVMMFVSEACNFDEHLIPSKKERNVALLQLVLSVKKDEKGLAAVTKNAYACREEMVQKMLVSNHHERPTASAVKEIFESISRQPQLFSKICPVPRQNPVFAGRKKLIRDLSSLLKEEQKDFHPTFILLHGIPGTGKNSIASELCHQFSESKLFSRGIFWFHADSRRVLENCYSKLIEEKKHCQNIKDLLAWFEQSSSVGKSLVIYENVKCYQEIEALLPSHVNCTVICTSRTNSADWPSKYHKLKIPLLPLKDCTSFVHSSMKLVKPRWEEYLYSDERALVPTLVTKLGQLTTPIAQAVAFIANKRKGGSEYLISHYLGLCENSFPDQILPYHAALLTTAKDIKELNPMAFTWLRFCSYLGTEGIPEALLDTLLSKTAEEEGKGIRISSKSEIIEILSSNAVMGYDTRTQSFSIDRAVQEPIQAKYKSSFWKTVISIGSILREVIPLAKKVRSDNQRSFKLRELAPHLETLLEHIEKHEVSQSSANCLLNCQDKDQQNKVLNLKLMLVTALKRFYTAQSDPHKIQSTVEQITLIKDELHIGWTGEWRLALELMAKGKALMKNVLRGQNTIPIETPGKMLEAIKVLKEAESVFISCENSSLRGEVVQCYFHLGRCYRSFLHPKYVHPEKRCQFSTEILEQVDNYVQNFKKYYTKALQLLVELAIAKRNVSQMLCLALKELAWGYYLEQDFINYEKYLVLALMSSGVQFHVQSDTDTSVDKPMIKILMEISTFQIDDTSLTEDLIQPSHPNPEEALNVIEMLRTFYKQRLPKEDLRLKILIRCRNRIRDIKKEIKTKKCIPQGKVDEKKKALYGKRGVVIKLSPIENKPLDIQAKEKMRLATEFKRQRKIKEAILAYQEALELSISWHKRDDSVLIANVYERIGECHARLGNQTESCINYRKAYKLWGSDPGSQSERDRAPDFAMLMQKYIRSLPKTEVELKLQLLKECVKVMESCFKENHSGIGIYKEVIGSTLLSQKRYQDAVQPLEESFKILKNLPTGNFNKLRCLESLLKVYEMLHEKQDSVEEYNTILKTEKKSAAEDEYQRSPSGEKSKRMKRRFQRRRGIVHSTTTTSVSSDDKKVDE